MDTVNKEKIMKTIFNTLVITIICTISFGVSAMECESINNGNNVKLDLIQDEVFITYNGTTQKYDVTAFYDGHLTSLVTGHGISIRFENHFGCFRNAVLSTVLSHNIQEISFDTCIGGSTPDELCLRNQ
jgi:hypothetical protein